MWKKDDQTMENNKADYIKRNIKLSTQSQLKGTFIISISIYLLNYHDTYIQYDHTHTTLFFVSDVCEYVYAWICDIHVYIWFLVIKMS